MYKIVASDLDGTFLSPTHKLTPFARETIQLLTQKNIHFVFATGRHHMDVAQICHNSGIETFMITSNGSRVHDIKGKLLFSHDLEMSVVHELVSLVNNSPDILTNVYSEDQWLMNRDSPEQRIYFQESVFDYHVVNASNTIPHGVCKIFYVCENHSKLLALESEINQHWKGKVNVSFSSMSCLEVMPSGVSKGDALTKVASLLGYSIKDCIAFGDGMNDLEMLTMSGKGCMMQGASQRLRESLPHVEVIGSNEEDAVAHYLRSLYHLC